MNRSPTSTETPMGLLYLKLTSERDYAEAMAARVARERLIASAPALYKAAAELIGLIDGIDPEDELTKEEWAALGSAKIKAEDNLRAALKQANGEAV